jgi:alpha-L-fucosidase
MYQDDEVLGDHRQILSKKSSPIYDYYLEKHGKPSEFGYKDFIPDFKAENFNAENWVKLFKGVNGNIWGLSNQ